MTEDPPGLDLVRLRAYLDRVRPGLVAGPLTARMIAGGRSNLTYVVTDDDPTGDRTDDATGSPSDSPAAQLVVRRPPLGHVLPTAHDMAREHRVMSALGPTPVPVPPTVLLCEDESVLGARFYVMEFVDGTPYRDASELEALGVVRTRSIANSLIDTLVDLHAVDPAAVGLADFGRPEGFLERQVRRWKKQLDGSRSRDLAGIDRLHERLSANVPMSPAPAIVHGDYRLDNVLVDSTDTITAVLDWEMSTLGDPLTDIALILAYAEHSKSQLDFVSSVSQAAGYPSPDEVIERYARKSGRDLSALDWYRGFAFFKLAVILEGIYYRFSQGQTVGEGFESISAGVEPLVAAGNRILEED